VVAARELHREFQLESHADQTDLSLLVAATLVQLAAHLWDALEHWLALVVLA
jgi:hypothetical protein